MSSTTKRLTLPVLGPVSSNGGVFGQRTMSASPFLGINDAFYGSMRNSPSGELLPAPPPPATRAPGDIMANLLQCAELKKVGGTFKTTKKWFVLYDDNLNPLAGGNDDEKRHSRQNSVGSDAGYVHIPAHLEYHDNEKKWREGKTPKNDIIIKECFNIYKKKDKDGLAGNIISVCTMKDTLDIVFEKEQDLLIWLELMLSCQQGGRSDKGRIKRPIYEDMWEVNVKGFKPELSSNNSTKFQISGVHRLAVTHDTVKFFELGSDEPKNFPISKISGHSQGKTRYLKLRTGWLSIAGRGEIEMDVKDQTVAEAIINAIFPSSRPKRNHLTSTSSSKSSKSRDSVQEVQGFSSSAKPIVNGPPSYRPRSESWSNPSVSHSLTGSGAKGILPGHPGNVVSASGLPKSGGHGSRLVHRDSRLRTSSEGNHFDLLSKGRKTTRSIMSSSPLSPGSGMSSESAGSTNSLDDPDYTSYENRYGPSMTPCTDHPSAATIIEESSGESWVDPVANREEAARQKLLQQDEIPKQLEQKTLQPSQLLVKTDASIDHNLQLYEESANERDANFKSGSVSYAQVQCLCNGETPSQVASENLASSPSHVQYSTILSSCSLHGPPRGVAGNDDYMMMSPPSATQSINQRLQNASSLATSGSSSSTSSLKRQTSAASSGIGKSNSATLERERRRLSMLGLDETAVNNMTSSLTSNMSSITSPSSQSSYNLGTDEYTLMSPSLDGGFALGGILAKHERSASNSSSVLLTRRQEQDEAYVNMSPFVNSSSRIPHRGSGSERPTLISSSPSSALTSHLTTLPLYTDVTCSSGSSSAPPTHLGSDKTSGEPPERGQAGDEAAPYLLMSPVCAVESNSLIGQLISSEERSTLLAAAKASRAENPEASTTVIGQRGHFNARSDEHPDEEPSTYMHMDFRSSKDSLSHVGGIGGNLGMQIPQSKVPEVSGKPGRLSPSSSTSVISCTPNSVTGSSDFLHQRLPSMTESGTEEVKRTVRSYGAKAMATSSSSSSISSSAAGGAKSRNIDIPRKAVADGKIVNNSPNTMAARLGSWFRNRAGSVPARPVFAGRRRHRTQSEGEKDSEGLPPPARNV